jgi:hypothetical protein
VTVLAGGYAELHRVSAGASTPITRTGGGAFDPAPSKDGRIFFMSLEPDGYVLRVLDERSAGFQPAAPPPSRRHAGRMPAERPAGKPALRPYALGKQEWSWLASSNYAPDQQSTELGVRFGDVIGRLDTLLIASAGDIEGIGLATAWRGFPIELHAHAYHTDDESGGELRAVWQRRFPRSRLTLEGGASDDLVFASVAFNTRQILGSLRLEEGARVEVDDEHYRAVVGAAIRTGSTRIAARYQRDGGATVTLGGLPSSILPRSAYALQILDPALPVAVLAGDRYDGWRIESTVPGLPFTAFYQRHELGDARLSLVGAEIQLSSDPFPILKLPGLDLTAGVARIFDAPLQDETKWWVGMRWRP